MERAHGRASGLRSSIRFSAALALGQLELAVGVARRDALRLDAFHLDAQQAGSCTHQVAPDPLADMLVGIFSLAFDAVGDPDDEVEVIQVHLDELGDAYPRCTVELPELADEPANVALNQPS